MAEWPRLMRAYGLTVLRVFVAAVFLLHGVEDLFGVRGDGLAATVDTVARFHLPAPYPLAVAASAAELACGLLLLVGAFTMWVTIVLLGSRLALFYQAYVATGVFLPGVAAARPEYELSLVLIGALIAVLMSGPGALSLDYRRHRSAERAAAGRARVRTGKV